MKNQKTKKPTYNFTEEQLSIYMKNYYREQLEQARKDMISNAMILMLTLPMEVLMDSYWKKSYRQKLPGFIKEVLGYFQKWEAGELDMDELQKDLWEYGGVRLERTK